jgi:receptor expression-enhancing protein 5/6
MSATTPENTTLNTAHNVLDQAKAKCRQFMSCLDKELSQVECCNEVEKRTGLPKANIALAAAVIYIVMIFFNLGAKLSTSVIAWVYPGIYSFYTCI